MTSRALTFGQTSYPLVLPNIRDPRLHVAAVIVTIHVLGQVGLGFGVSVPQILVAILTCAVIEVVLTFRQTRSFVWPASAMLTGSGVALILRVGTPPGDHWAIEGAEVFAGVAAFSLFTKYVIRYRGTHMFNPSNVGLAVAFVVLGSARVEPLDFWWGTLDVWMIAAYTVIIGGGLLITRRLRLLELAATFWVAFAIAIGLLAASGHCMVANWSFTPVCGADFWRVLITSPEVLIFLFFMITDPKTVPRGRVGRIAFGSLVAVTSTMLIAPQAAEFGAKVGLLTGLVLVCAARPVLDRVVPAPGSVGDSLSAAARWLLGGTSGSGIARPAARGALGAAVVLIIGLAIAVAGTPARGFVAARLDEVLNREPHHVDQATLPAITVDREVGEFDISLLGPGAQGLVVTLGENLLLEAEALRRRDVTILVAVDHGDRLDEMRARLAAAVATGVATIEQYAFESVTMSLIAPFGQQNGLSVGLDARGVVTVETYDAGGALLSRESSAFAKMFVIRRATGGRWLNVAVLPPKAGPG